MNSFQVVVVLRQAYHQGLHLLVDRGASRNLALLGAITLLRHALAMPGKNGLGLHNVGHFSQGLLAQLLADLRQGLALAVTQPEAPLDLVP
jgi:hypothetical protein